MNILSTDDCVFCNSKSTTFGNTPEFERIVENKIKSRLLFETENFAVFPTVGQIVEGYLLIMPKTHVTSIASLDDHLLEELEYVYKEVRSILKNNYSEPIFFEHGVCRSEYKFNGCCVDHAHIHAVPASVNVSNELKKEYKYTKINKISELGKYARNENYLYVNDISGNHFIFEANEIRSQHIRYLVSEILNTPNKGDWTLYPGKQEIISTIEKLSNEKIKKFQDSILIVEDGRQ